MAIYAILSRWIEQFRPRLMESCSPLGFVVLGRLPVSDPKANDRSLGKALLPIIGDPCELYMNVEPADDDYSFGRLFDQVRPHPSWLPCLIDLVRRDPEWLHSNVYNIEGLAVYSAEWLRLYPDEVGSVLCAAAKDGSTRSFALQSFAYYLDRGHYPAPANVTSCLLLIGREWESFSDLELNFLIASLSHLEGEAAKGALDLIRENIPQNYLQSKEKLRFL
jgi:hypothetical protein